jgi:hypothetical protein
MEDPPPPPPVKYRLKPKTDFARANDDAADRKKSNQHHVFAWREDGREIEKRGGLDEVTPIARSNRRASDYWLTLIFLNTLFAAIGFWGRENLFILVSCGAGIVVFTVAFSWIMWGIVRRY